MEKFFRIISWLFMPLTMPLIALIIVMYTPSYMDIATQTNGLFLLNDAAKLFFLRSFALFGWVFPVVSILILKYSRYIDSVELDNQKQRMIPLFLSGMYAAMLYALLLRFHTQVVLSSHLFALTASGVLIAAISMLVNMRFKISLHASGVGILLGFLFSYSMEQSLLVMWPIYVACIVGGLVIASRMFLNKHTNKELIFGFLVAFICTFSLDYFFTLYF